MIRFDKSLNQRFPLQFEVANVTQVKLSVVVLAFGHEHTILQCLESIAMQVTNFDYEVVVGLNDSADKTDLIVRDFTLKRENWRCINLSRSEGTQTAGLSTGAGNFYNCLRHVQGEYVCVVEGDDYLISQSRFQVQCDLLNLHPLWSGTMMPISVETEAGVIRDFRSMYQYDRVMRCNSSELSSEDFIINGCVIHLLGIMFRTNCLRLQDFYLKSAAQDHILGLALTLPAPIGYVELEEMAVYRSYGGTFNTLSVHRNRVLSLAKWAVINAMIEPDMRVLAQSKFDGILTSLLQSIEMKQSRELSWSEIVAMVKRKIVRRVKFNR